MNIVNISLLLINIYLHLKNFYIIIRNILFFQCLLISRQIPSNPRHIPFQEIYRLAAAHRAESGEIPAMASATGVGTAITAKFISTCTAELPIICQPMTNWASTLSLHHPLPPYHCQYKPHRHLSEALQKAPAPWGIPLLFLALQAKERTPLLLPLPCQTLSRFLNPQRLHLRICQPSCLQQHLVLYDIIHIDNGKYRRSP